MYARQTKHALSEPFSRHRAKKILSPRRVCRYSALGVSPDLVKNSLEIAAIRS